MNNKPVDTPKRQSATTGLESLEQAPSSSNATTVSASQNGASNFSSIQKRPSRPWKKQAILIVVLLLFVGGLSFAALRLSAKINQGTNSQDLAGSFKPVGNPVLGAESILPVQSLNDKTVTINGDLTVNGKLKLSAEAINDLAGVVGNKVSLSPTQGGPVQTGNISISGTVVASNFQGNGAGLSNLNASSVTSGTLSNDRLDASVTRLGQTIPLSALQSTVLSSLNGISNNGNVDIVGSGSLSVTTDLLNNQIVLSTSSGGDITSVIAGTGLIGGGATGDVTLDIDTGLVTVQGNTFNGASQLVKLNGAGELPVLSATNLTNLNASNLGTGTLNDARLGANVTLQGNTFNLANKLVKLDNSGNLPALNGSAITNLNAGNLGTGTLDDARLSANVALLDANQTFTGNVAFSQSLQVNTIQPSAAMTIGATNQSLTLQGDLTTSLTGTGGTGTVSLGFTGTPVGTIAYQLDASAPAGTYTLCTTVGNCAGSGTGVTSLGGTTNKLAKFTGGQAIDDSSITDDGTLVTVGANALYKAGADSTTAFRIQNAAGSNNVFTADSTNNRVAIGQATAGYTLDVNGDINSATGLRVGGNLVCDSNGCAASGQSGFYIQNGTATQSAANFNIESTSNSTPTAVLKLKSSQTADLLQARDASNNVIAKIDASGNVSTTGQFQVSGTQISSANLSNDANLAKLNGTQTFTAANLFRNAGDSTTAFRIQNAAASNLFVADTSNTRIAIGQATAGYTLDVNGDINITNGSSYRINGVAICGPTATCAPSSGSSNYLQNGLTVQTANMNIQSATNSSVVAIVQGAAGQTADLLQARDSNDNIVAKITSSGAIYQGANQVCDASNNCNFAQGSGSGNYIQNGTSVQTANMNIKSADANNATATIQGSTAQVADILQVTSGGGATLLGVGQNTPNIITNPSFDTDTSGWSTLGSASVSRSTADQYIGPSSMLVTTTAAANDGVKYDYQFAANTSYAVSFYSRVNVAQWGAMQITFTNNGSTQSNCSNNLVVITGGWTRYTCTFTTAASVSGTRFIGIRQTDATARSFYVDAVQVEPGTTNTAFQQGTIQLNGVINSPVAIRTPSNSNTAFSLQNATGTNIFSLSNVGLGSASVSNGFSLASVGSLSVSAASNAALTVSGGGAFSQYIGGNVYNGGSLTVGDVTQNSTPLIVNPSAGTNLFGTVSNFDTGTGGVSALGSAALTRSTAEQYSGIGSLRVATTAAANDGVRQIWTSLTPNTTYTLSAHVKASGSNFSTFEMGYTDNTTFTSCLTGQTVSTALWQRYSCTFTTPASVARIAYFRQTDATSRVFFLDAMQVEIGSTLTPFQSGTMNFSGMFTGPSVFRNQSDTTTAFQIQNNAGTSNLFVADTYNNRIAIGKATSGYALDVAGDINSDTAIRVGGNQVCDSTGCVTSSTSGIKNQTTTQTANMNIQSASTTQPTAVIQGANAQTADILQVKDGTSAGNTLFAVNQTTSNLISNPSFEVDTAGWSPKGSATISRSTAQKLYGDASLAIAFTGANGDGATFAYNLAPATSYTLSMSVYMTAVGQYTNPIYSSDGTTQTGCATYVGTANTWQRFVCGFTTSSVSGATYIGLSKSFASAGTAYIDGVQLEAGTSGTNFQQGQISLNGVVNSQTVYRNSTNSNTAFQIQNSAGANVLIADTVNSRICIASCQTSTPAMILDGSGLNFSNISNSSTKITQTNNGLQFGIGNGGFSGVQIAGNSGYTGNLFNIQSGANSSAILNVTQNNANLLVNPSFDTNTTGWTNLNSTTLTRTTAETYSGPAGLAVGPTAATGDGVRQSYSLATNTNYAFSFYVKGTSAFSTLEAGYVVGSTYTSCATAQAVTTGWNRISCTFTTPASWGGTPSMYVRQTDATARTFYVDAFQLETGSVRTNYSLGSISLNGTVTSPTVFQNQSNSTTAFQVQNAAGTNILNVNTAGSSATIGSGLVLSDTGITKNSSGTLNISTGLSGGGIAISAASANGTTITGLTGGSTAINILRVGSENTSNISNTAGTSTGITVNPIFQPVTGNGNFIGVNISPTIFQTGSATGDYTALQIRPTVTAATGTNQLLIDAGTVANPGQLTMLSTGEFKLKNATNSTAAFQVQNSAAASIFQVDTTNSRVGIGNASPGNLLSVGALTLADPDAQLAVGTGGDSKKGIVIQAVAGQTADFFQAQDSTGAVLASIDPEGNLAVRNVTVSGHIISAGPVPTMELVGTATGTAPISQIFGTDVAGVVVLAADVDGTGSGAFIHVTFAEQYTGIPMVVLTPSSEDAAILTGSSAVYAYGDPDGAGFTIAVGPGGLPTNVPYAWTYHVIQ